jgi:5-deoxy-5-amino-3-dehydroquinate synthase
MICAAHLARRLGRIDDARVALHYEVLASYGLESSLPTDIDHAALVEAMGRDKKATSGLVFVLDGANGLETVPEVDPARVMDALAAATGVR